MGSFSLWCSVFSQCFVRGWVRDTLRKSVPSNFVTCIPEEAQFCLLLLLHHFLLHAWKWEAFCLHFLHALYRCGDRRSFVQNQARHGVIGLKRGIGEQYGYVKAGAGWQALQDLYSLICRSLSCSERHFLVLWLWNQNADWGCVFGSKGWELWDVGSTKWESYTPDHNKKNLVQLPEAAGRFHDRAAAFSWPVFLIVLILGLEISA